MRGNESFANHILRAADNSRRRHSTLGYISPVDFEQKAVLAQLGARKRQQASLSQELNRAGLGE